MQSLCELKRSLLCGKDIICTFCATSLILSHEKYISAKFFSIWDPFKMHFYWLCLQFEIHMEMPSSGGAKISIQVHRKITAQGTTPCLLLYILISKGQFSFNPRQIVCEQIVNTSKYSKCNSRKLELKAAPGLYIWILHDHLTLNYFPWLERKRNWQLCSFSSSAFTSRRLIYWYI